MHHNPDQGKLSEGQDVHYPLVRALDMALDCQTFDESEACTQLPPSLAPEGPAIEQHWRMKPSVLAKAALSADSKREWIYKTLYPFRGMASKNLF